MSARWSYGNAQNSSAGTMVCTACGKKITDGLYRYRQKSSKGDWKYVVQHQACTPEDPEWVAMLKRRDAAASAARELSDACREFRDRWGVTELDDYILPGGDT